jgi:hypothetical protein
MGTDTMLKKRTFLVMVLLAGLSLLFFAPIKKWFAASGQKSLAPCVNNLVLINGAKEQWALARGKGSNDVPTWNDLRPYFPDRWSNGMPMCPDGGTYTIGRIGEPPSCSIGGPNHRLPQ